MTLRTHAGFRIRSDIDRIRIQPLSGQTGFGIRVLKTDPDPEKFVKPDPKEFENQIWIQRNLKTEPGSRQKHQKFHGRS